MAQEINMENGAEKSAPLLYEISAPEVFQMVRILRILGFDNVNSLVDAKTRRDLSYSPPKMMKGGKQTDLPRGKWTEAQLEAETRYQVAVSGLVIRLMEIMVDKFGDPEFEIAVYTLLAMGTRTDKEQIRGLSGIAFVTLLNDYISREDFADFFREAWKLFSRSASTVSGTSLIEGMQALGRL